MEPTAKVDFDPRIQLPNHALFVGASQSGKTRLCLHLISRPELFHPRPVRILFYYDQLQDNYLDTQRQLAKQGVELLLIQGCAGLNMKTLQRGQGQTLVIVDDFSEESSSSSDIARITTNGRHLNVSLWLIWHSLYSKHAASRIISQNVRWFFFLPSLRLESQLRTFGGQLGMRAQVLYAYNRIQEDKDEHRYLLVDAGPNTPRLLRLRSHIHLPIQYCYA